MEFKQDDVCAYTCPNTPNVVAHKVGGSWVRNEETAAG